MNAAILMVVLLGWAENARTWTDASGSFKVDAVFIRLDDGNVVLQKNDGKQVTVPLGKLSDADQAHVRSLSTTAPLIGIIQSVEKQANSLRTASDVVLLYTTLANDKSLASYLPHLETRRKHWESLAKAKSIRMGDKWLSLEDAKKLEETERQLLDEAQRLIDVKNLELAGERLRKASHANPQSIKADFLIGLVLSLALGQPAEAQKYFNSCVQRREKNQFSLSDSERANLIAALNNLAITKVREAEYRAALVAWKKALELAPPSKELVQNLGKMGELASTHPHLKIPESVAREASALYSKVAVQASAGKFRRETGWLFMRLVDEPTVAQILGIEPTIDKPASPKPPIPTAPQLADLVLVGNGTGFVVAQNYVVTNHHVVDNAAVIRLVPASTPDKQFNARVVASTSNPDLALLQATDLSVAPVRVRPTLPKLGADMALVGFPASDTFGAGLKATRGVMSGLPDVTTENMLLYDAVTNPGNSGGPVFDKFGRVFAVHARGLGALAVGTLNAGKLGAGIPSSQLLAFLSAHAEVKVLTDDPGEKELAWEDAVEAVGSSTVQVLIYQRPSVMKLARRETQRNEVVKWDAYEDGWCMSCHGSSLIDCPSAGCANGKIRSQGVARLGTTANGTAITKRVINFERCDGCNGRGKVRCPHCRDGIEVQARDN